MKHQVKSIRRLLAVAAVCLSTGAFAGGNHAGGHDHDHGDDAIGKPGVAAKVTRTITVEMSDAMRYSPSDIQVKQGETVRLVVKNLGQVKHELSLGTEKPLPCRVVQRRLGCEAMFLLFLFPTARFCSLQPWRGLWR